MSQRNQRLDESGFSKLFEYLKGNEMGNLPMRLGLQKRQQPEEKERSRLEIGIEALEEIVSATKGLDERCHQEKEVITIEDDDDHVNAAELVNTSFLDKHPVPRGSPVRSVEFQVPPLDDEVYKRGIDNSDLVQIDVARAQQELELEALQECRRRERAEIEEQIRKGQRERIQAQIEDETTKRLESAFGELILDVPRVPESFRPLSEEAVKLINRAWSRVDSEDEVLMEDGAVKIIRKDLLTLYGLDWLNDEVINYYLSLISTRSKCDTSLPKVYAFQTFFYTTLGQRGFVGVKRWTRKVDLFSFDMWIVPVHLTNHWCMAIVDLEQQKIEYYDSMLGDNCRVFRLLCDYMMSEMKDKKKVDFNMANWQFIRRTDIPVQRNGSDCGMFACKFAEYASRRAEIDFSQKHMSYFRQRMVFEICQKKLM